MVRKRDGERESHTVSLRSETHDRLGRYKVKLIGERGTPNVSFDDAVISLLDSVKAK